MLLIENMKNSWQRGFSRGMIYAGLIVAVIFFLLPLYVMVVTSFKDA